MFPLHRWSWFTASGLFAPEKKSLLSTEPTQGAAVETTPLKVELEIQKQQHPIFLYFQSKNIYNESNCLSPWALKKPGQKYWSYLNYLTKGSGFWSLIYLKYWPSVWLCCLQHSLLCVLTTASDLAEGVCLVSAKNAKFSDEMDERQCSHPKSGCDVDVVLTLPSLCVPHLVPVPRFTLAVNLSAKSFNVTVESDEKVKALWCYRSNDNCMVDDDVTPVAVRNPPRHLRLPSWPLDFL